MRVDSLARKLQNNNHYEFWKGVTDMNNSKTSIPSNTEGVCGPVKIADVWFEHCCNLFTCVKNNVFVVENVNLFENLVIKLDDVYAIMILDNNNTTYEMPVIGSVLCLPCVLMALWFMASF